MCTKEPYNYLISIEKEEEDITFLRFCLLGTLTPSLVPVKPFVEPSSDNIPTIEIEEFTPDVASLSNTFDSYVNNLYVRPMSLKFDSQKAFAKVGFCKLYLFCCSGIYCSLYLT